MKKERLGELLLQKGLISVQQLEFCLTIHKNVPEKKLGHILKHYNLVSELDITRALASQVGWDFFQGDYVPDMESLKPFSLPFLTERLVYPLRFNSLPAFVLARTDDTQTTDTLHKAFKTNIHLMVSTEEDLHFALECLARDLNSKSNAFSAGLTDSGEENILNWFEELFKRAVAQGATDIHIEPSFHTVEIRCRIDGLLYFADSLRKEFLPRIVNIIFNKADVTISDFYNFHDARFSANVLGKEVDIRVSHIPSIHGSSLVLRLLDKGKTAIPLTQLGYAPYHWETIIRMLKKPNGIILVAGPTGCGKTTTLYAILNFLKSLSTKIITIEDPAEVQLSLITQVQIHEKRGIGFHEATRSFLRHDPDIILIGEIRDPETAQEALRASMTGHKVFSTLHTNTPLDALFRLKDLGVDPSEMANSLNGIITQRLLRKLCPYCKVKIKSSEINLDEFKKKYLWEDDQEIFEEKGCDKCIDGFWGRTVVAEILSINDEIRTLIAEKKFHTIYQTIKADPQYIHLIKDAQRLVKEGITCVTEAVRVLG